MDLKNKVALVTGGASGIGRTISLELAKKGAIVFVNYNKSQDKAKSLVDEIESFGGRAYHFQADVSNYDDAKNLIDFIVSKETTLNIVVNNAGITDDALILRMTEDQFDHVIETNLKGVWNICKHSAKVLLKSGYGRLINISSVSGVMGNAGQSNYSSAKAGIIGMTKALAREFASRGVTVNAIAPGFMRTPLTQRRLDTPNDEAVAKWLSGTPMNRVGTPDELVGIALYLASDMASFTTGACISIDGGYTCL
jgi:3-oxoacyl-[acyl-carrier protein] reductase